MTQCTANSKQTGQQCKRPATPGATVCKWHGANAPQTARKAAARHAAALELQEAAKAVNLFGGKRDIHPAQALLELVQTKAAEVAYWRFRVSEIAEESLTWGTSKVKTGGDDYGVTDEAKPHIALVMLRQAERDLADYASASLKAGVEAAQVEIAKAHAALLASVLRAIVSDPRVTVSGPADVVIVDALRGLELTT